MGEQRFGGALLVRAPGKFYVSIDGKEELLFARGRQRVPIANEFRLYYSDRTRLLDKISVTTAINPRAKIRAASFSFDVQRLCIQQIVIDRHR
jgi:hypothetical protein